MEKFKVSNKNIFHGTSLRVIGIVLGGVGAGDAKGRVQGHEIIDVGGGEFDLQVRQRLLMTLYPSGVKRNQKVKIITLRRMRMRDSRNPFPVFKSEQPTTH